MEGSGRQQRSVKIDSDERLGWSSERIGGKRDRPADISVRNRVLSPSDELRYSPGSLVVLVCAAPKQAEAFANRLLDNKSPLFSHAKVRGLLAGRVAEDELEARTAELLSAAVAKRLEAGETVVLVASGLAVEEREPFVRMAAEAGRPRHLILLEPTGVEPSGDERALLTDLRRRLAAGELGQEGFATALRLAGTSIGEVKRLEFQRPQRDD